MSEMPKKRRTKVRPCVVRTAANLLLPLAITFGGYVILHGDSSPGGGFQGGVLVAAAVLLVYLGHGLKKVRGVFKTGFLHSTETIAELLYIAIGCIGVLVGVSFAANFVMEQFGLETAVLMNHAVGYHVLAGVGCLLIMMLGLLSGGEGDGKEEETNDH